MPRDSRKMNKRRTDRNIALSSIRNMQPSSCASNRYSPFSRETPRRSPAALKNDSLRLIESSVFTLTPRESPELSPSVSNVTLPATSTSISIPPNEVKFEKIQPKEVDVIRSASALPLMKKAPLPSYKEIIQHGIEYIMLPINLLQFCLWKNNSGVVVPPLDFKKEISPSQTPRNPPPHHISLPQTPASPKPSTITSSTFPSIPPSPQRLPRPHFDSSSDDSDSMVTADESDQSSSSRWTTASSATPFISMSVDFSNNNSAKHTNLNVTEEPMEIALEDSPYQMKSPPREKRVPPRARLSPPHQRGTVIQRDAIDYSSESESDSAWSNRVSSVDSEIARVFARARASSSSDEEEGSDVEGPRSGAYLSPSTPSKLRSGAPLLLRRATQQTPFKRRPRVVKKKESPLIRTTPTRFPRSRLASPSDSAYSEEEAVMSFHEPYVPAPASAPVVESMEQDVNYGADNEDSNDSDGVGPLIPRQLLFESPDPEHQAPMVAPEYPAGPHPGLEEREELAQRERLQRWSDTFNLDKSMLHLQIARNSGGFPGFAPGRCYCGGGGFYPVPVAVPVGPGPAQPLQRPWMPQDMYPPAPSPMPHLYYQYPEFMNPPAGGFGGEGPYGGDFGGYNFMYNYSGEYNPAYWQGF